MAVAVSIAFAVLVSAGAGVDSEAAADFKWFSGLGFPDVADCPYVRITSGSWELMRSARVPDDCHDGFLLASSGQAPHFLTLNLTELPLTNSAAETNEDQRIEYTALDLKSEARRALEIAQSLPTNYDAVPSFGRPLTDQTETFVLAWACWRHGLNEQAAELYLQAKKLPNWGLDRFSGFDRDTPKSFRESLEKNLAFVVMAHAVDSFGDPSISRPQLRRMFQSIATNYPDSMWNEKAVRVVDILGRMIAEDEAHAKNPVTNFDQLQVDARISELLFRLREQNGHQIFQPGQCDIFEDLAPGSNTNTPAHQLVRLGYAAIPRLIAALDDQTFTRSVGSWPGNWYGVMTVGDCAEAILQRITGRSFYTWTPSANDNSEDQRMSATRKAAEAWWAECQAKGEKQMLVDEILSPGKEAPAEAEILCRQYPDVAVPTLVKAIGATTNESIRSDLVIVLGTIEGGDGVDFLRKEMTNSPVLKSRVDAAFGLRRVDKEAAVAAMIIEWIKFDGPTENPGNGGSELIRFLAGSDSPDAVRALAQNIETRAVDTRLEIVDEIDFSWSLCCTSNSPATQSASEDFLVRELADTEERVGMEISRDGKDLLDPRSCDVAGEILAERRSDRYSFDMASPLKARDRDRIECINVWRKAHNLPAFPLPSGPAMRLSPNRATTVTEIEWDERSIKPNAKFARMVDTLKGAPLDTGRIIKLLTYYAATPEIPSAGIHLEAMKDTDLAGVRLRISLLPGKQLTNQQDYDVSQHVVLGGKMLLESGGGGGTDNLGSADGWDELTQAMNQALAGSPQTPFEIGVQIKADSSASIFLQ